jgi:hypothetical protein
MQDEQFMRQWNAGRDRFSVDLDRGLGHLNRQLRQRRQTRKPIGNSYGFLDRYAGPAPAKATLSSEAQASLRGLAATVLTFALWVTVMAVATPMPLLAA